MSGKVSSWLLSPGIDLHGQQASHKFSSPPQPIRPPASAGIPRSPGSTSSSSTSELRARGGASAEPLTQGGATPETPTHGGAQYYEPGLNRFDDGYEKNAVHVSGLDAPVDVSQNMQTAAIVALAACLTVFVIVFLIAAVVAYSDSTSLEDEFHAQVALSFNIQQGMFMGTRMSIFCATEHMINCIDAGKSASECDATTLDLVTKCPVDCTVFAPDTGLCDLLNGAGVLVDASNVESALDQTDTTTASEFAQQLDSLVGDTSSSPPSPSSPRSPW